MMFSEQMMPQYNNPGQSTSRYDYSYFQDPPFYSEQQTCAPLVMKAHSSFMERENSYHFQFEDEISDKENQYQQLNPSPSTSLPKKSGRHVRFSFQTTEKKKQASDVSRSTPTGTDLCKSPKVRKQIIDISIELPFYCYR